jgi:hypothetical protein
LSKFINTAALDGYIEEKVAESVAAALATVQRRPVAHKR